MTTTIPDAPLRDQLDVALDRYTAGWTERDDALRKRIAELENTPAPGPDRTLFGCSKPDIAPAGSMFGVTRTYLGAGKRPTSFTADSGIRRAVEYSTDAVMLSWKDIPGGWLDSLLDSMSDLGRTVYATQNHEPIKEFTGRELEYHSRWAAALPIMSRYPFVVPAMILEGWQLDAWDRFYRDDVPVLGFDRYNPPLDNPTRYNAPATVFDPMIDYVESRGRRTIVGETGTRLVGSDEAGRERWAMDLHDYLDGRVEAACWWLGHPDFVTPPATFSRFVNG